MGRGFFVFGLVWLCGGKEEVKVFVGGVGERKGKGFGECKELERLVV